MAVKVVGGTWAAYAQARICGDVGGTLRLDVLDAWLARHRLREARQADQGARHDAFTSGPAARGVAALTSRVRELEIGLQIGLLGGLRALAQLVPLLGLLFWMAPRLAAAAFLVVIPFSLGLSVARRRWKRANARAARQHEALLEAADEAVRHADLWTTFGAEARVRTHVAAIGRALANGAARLDASGSALSGANELLGAVALVLALAASRAGWLGDPAQASMLLPFAVVFFLGYRPVRDLTDARLALTRASVAWEGLRGLLEPDDGEAADRPAPDRGAAAVARPFRPGVLSVERVVLARGSGRPITFRAEPGAIVCIVGPTGSGKTTLLRALLGLDPTRAGTVRYDGVDLADAPPGPRARPFAWVPQDAPILADTLDANVALGASPAGGARGALTALGAEALVDALGDARLGAGGRSVSGGERQWIALARALATRQPVLLLDEPTSGLDAESQARVLDAIARLRGERTILLVTHRPEPLAIADAVVRIDEDAASLLEDELAEAERVAERQRQRPHAAAARAGA